MIDKLSMVTIVNNEKLYLNSIKSLERQGVKNYFEFIPVNADKMGWNAAKSLNHGIEKAKSDWVICAHQDVVFPAGWLANLLAELQKIPQKVAVIGLVGNRALGKFVGHILHPRGHSRWTPLPSKVISVDEHVIIINRQLNVWFDEANPGFHCYGVDICLSAKEKGYESLVIDAPVHHLSGGKIDNSFHVSAEWILMKWGKTSNFTIPTCAEVITIPSFWNIMKRTIIRFNRHLSIGYSFHNCNCNKIQF